jgi:prepilin signal peptidase PulO-like enzyme (type II secretory pathway)
LLGLGWAVLLLRGHWENPADAAGWIVFALAGVPVALIDWDTFEIPDGLVVVGGAASVLARMLFSDVPVDELAVSLRAGLLACGLLYAISFLSRVGLGWIGAWARSVLAGRPASDRRRFPHWTRLFLRWSRFHPDIEALGLGDVSLALAAGAALGFPAIFLGLPFAAIFGMVGWLLRPQEVARQQTSLAGLDRQALPFGPFLVAGFLVAALLLENGMSPLL